MSYEIIKKIKINNGKVLITYTSNNVYPRTFDECESESLSRILREKGREELDIEILRTYEGGSFQKGNNKYTRALKVLRHFPEYNKFDWRGNNEENRNKPEFKELLKRALYTYLPKDRFIIAKVYNGNKIYGQRRRNSMRWVNEKGKASVYCYQSDAEFMKKCYYNTENWIVEKIN